MRGDIRSRIQSFDVAIWLAFNMRHLHLPLADIASIVDNSDAAGSIIAEKRIDGHFIAHDSAKWAAIEEAAR